MTSQTLNSANNFDVTGHRLKNFGKLFQNFSSRTIKTKIPCANKGLLRHHAKGLFGKKCCKSETLLLPLIVVCKLPHHRHYSSWKTWLKNPLFMFLFSTSSSRAYFCYNNSNTSGKLT